MNGLMMQWPLLISSLLVHAERHHGEQEIVSRRVEGDIHRTTFAELAARSRRMANALARLGVKSGDRVGTLAWNGYRHLEVYYAASGSGAVLHTLNPRLHPDQLAYIANHAEDKVLCFDMTFLPLVEAVAAKLASVRHFVAMTDRAHMPAASKIPGLLCYEDLVEAESDAFAWPEFDENTASSLCYTSGTTGNPKGALYSHRSTVLHTFAISLPDALNLASRDVILPVVPMFHVNAWGLPYAACMTGAKLVFPGPGLDGKSLYELFEGEGVTLSAGVPTVWQGLLTYVDANDLRFSTMTRTIIGGSACPPAMMRTFQDRYGVKVLHAWGMTEMSPVGTIAILKGSQKNLSGEEQFQVQSQAGPRGLRRRHEDRRRPEPGSGLGRQGLGRADGARPLGDRRVLQGRRRRPAGQGRPGHGWFPTGDVATIDADGFMQITDRSKDVIKSGGEWIGSIDLENIAMAHPCVAMAACIAAEHKKWDERPLLVVVKKPGAELTRDELIAFYEGRIAKWWTPDDVVFVDAIPLGATGKMLKNRLREQYGKRLVEGS